MSELPDTMPAMELVHCAAITYRQLDSWTSHGWLRPDERPDGKQGTGYRRSYPEAELEVATGMGLLTRAGIAANVAAKIARRGDDLTQAILLLIESTEVSNG